MARLFAEKIVQMINPRHSASALLLLSVHSPTLIPPPRPVAPNVSAPPYRKLQQGRDYRILDDALADPQAIRERLLQRNDWTFGAPYRQKAWPGMQALPARLPDELESIESWVRKQTGSKRLTQRASPEGTTLNNNCVQLVGADEGVVRPHTDSRLLCNYHYCCKFGPTFPVLRQ